MQELKPGAYRWTSAHPEWVPGEEWDQTVVSYAIDDGTTLAVIDPISAPIALDQLASRRAAVIVLTCQWHRRDAVELAARYQAAIYAPPPEPQDPNPLDAKIYQAGDELPAGIVALTGIEASDPLLWVSRVGAIISGDTLISKDGKLVIPTDWVAGQTVTTQAVVAALQPLLKLPIELVLPTHGDPCGPEVLRALLT